MRMSTVAGVFTFQLRRSAFKMALNSPSEMLLTGVEGFTITAMSPAAIVESGAEGAEPEAASAALNTALTRRMRCKVFSWFFMSSSQKVNAVWKKAPFTRGFPGSGERLRYSALRAAKSETS